MNKRDLQIYFQFFLVVLAGGSIYLLIYLRTNYQQTILEVFGISPEQLNDLYRALAIVYILGYFPSGFLADRFSVRWLLAISMVMVGLGGLWFAQVPNYGSVIAIFAVWGCFSVFTFWASHLKAIKLLTTPENEGRFFGILDGGRGVIEAILASFSLGLFASIAGNQAQIAQEVKREALVSVIYLYSVVVILIGILIAVFFRPSKDRAPEEPRHSASGSSPAVSAEPGIPWNRGLIMVLKNKYIMLLGGIIFMGYAVFWTNYYYAGFLQKNIGLTAVQAGQVTLGVLWMRPIGGTIGGILADRVGKAPVLGSALLIGSALLLTISVLPVTALPLVFTVLFITLGLMIYIIRGVYWSLLGNCRINTAIMGLGIGTISFIGYLPDIVLPTVSSHFITLYGEKYHYNAYFLLSAVLGLIGVVCLWFFQWFGKREARRDNPEIKSNGSL